MNIRSFAALALAAPLLHLNVARVDAACGKHSHASARAHSAPAHTTAHEGTAHSPLAHAGQAQLDANKDSCETPTQPECCEALSSCSSAFAADDELAIDGRDGWHQTAAGALINIPLSRVATPDPPPPKA